MRSMRSATTLSVSSHTMVDSYTVSVSKKASLVQKVIFFIFAAAASAITVGTPTHTPQIHPCTPLGEERGRQEGQTLCDFHLFFFNLLLLLLLPLPPLSPSPPLSTLSTFSTTLSSPSSPTPHYHHPPSSSTHPLHPTPQRTPQPSQGTGMRRLVNF